MMFASLEYPFVVGTDVTGEVVEIRSRITRFNIGDRLVWTISTTGQTKGAFQRALL
jgi:NADPH:quinone reductase-like Zn-dependent oxidoreductase